MNSSPLTGWAVLFMGSKRKNEGPLSALFGLTWHFDGRERSPALTKADAGSDFGSILPIEF